MIRVLSTASVPPIGHRAFADIGPIERLDGEGRALEEAQVLLVRSERLTGSDIARARRLRVIARTGSGVDNIDVEAATRARIPVLFAPAAGARPVAEGTMALILAAAKRLGEHELVLREGPWESRYEVVGHDLRGAVLGIVGFGQIGREVCELAAAFGMKVVVYDPSEEGRWPKLPARFAPLPELVASADMVTLHCPLTAETRGLVNHGFIERMKDGSVLVNAARGEVIAGDALLLEALDRGKLSAVGLDVFEQEPPSRTSQLLSDPRVICTPHAVGLTRSWNEQVFSMLAADTRRVLDGAPARHVVNPDALGAAAAR
jgi:D-3-phosphoglycerate dehydrogenase